MSDLLLEAVYIYPREVFPPTDFHTATLVNDHVCIIGNLGYIEDRRPGYTTVYRLDIKTLKMEKLETSGDLHGWISNHKAYFDGKSTITIIGGKLIVDKNGNQDYVNNEQDCSLDLRSMEWKRWLRNEIDRSP